MIYRTRAVGARAFEAEVPGTGVPARSFSSNTFAKKCYDKYFMSSIEKDFMRYCTHAVGT